MRRASPFLRPRTVHCLPPHPNLITAHYLPSSQPNLTPTLTRAPTTCPHPNLILTLSLTLARAPTACP